MRVLYVVPNVPSPVRARPFNFIRLLSRNHQISILCLASDNSDRRFVSELSGYCQSLEVIELPRLTSFWNSFLALFSSRVVRYAYFHSARLRHRVNEKIAAHEVDVIHIEHLKSFSMVQDVIGKIPTVFDAVDCVSMFELRRERVIRNPLHKIFSWMEYRKMLSHESSAAARFGQLVITSENDKEAYPAVELLKRKIHVVPNGVDLDYFDFLQFQPQRNLLVFCAKLDYFANIDAALYFAHSIWPRLRARRPDLQLEIVGNRPPKRVTRLSGRENIQVSGSVPDVRPFLGRAWVALCPIRVQAGIQNKILEAMALGVPIVVTSICCRGLGVESGKHVLVADTPGEFVSSIELLLDNVTLRNTLVEAARKFVEANHDWSRAAERLTQIYEQAQADFAIAGEPVAVT